GLEQLDQVARWVLDQDLPAAGSRDDVVAELDAFGLQPGDLCIQVRVDEMDAVPASGPGLSTIWHGAACRTLGAAEQQAQISPDDGRERRARRPHLLESEMLGVEVNCCADVAHHVAHMRRVVVHFAAHVQLLSLWCSEDSWAINNPTRSSISSAV